MIGIVVITHGGLAQELLGAAGMIVGEIPSSAAVSIGWGEDPAAVHKAIEQALAQVGAEDVLILTDMFGGTPTNLSLPFLSRRVEIVTGVNLPMLIKLAKAPEETDLLALARDLREHGRAAIRVASDLLRADPERRDT